MIMYFHNGHRQVDQGKLQQQIEQLDEQIDLNNDKIKDINHRIDQVVKMHEEDALGLEKTLREKKMVSTADLIIKLDQMLHENREAIKELQDKRKELLSYVTVMPHKNPIEDPNVLTPDEIYTLNTQGYQRDPKKEVDDPSGMPPAKPNSDHEKLGLNTGGLPEGQVIHDRLNSSERFEDMLRRWAVGSQQHLNQTLQKAQAKTGPDLARKVKAEREEEQQKHQDQLERLKKVVEVSPQMESYMNAITRMSR